MTAQRGPNADRRPLNERYRYPISDPKPAALQPGEVELPLRIIVDPNRQTVTIRCECYKDGQPVDEWQRGLVMSGAAADDPEEFGRVFLLAVRHGTEDIKSTS